MLTHDRVSVINYTDSLSSECLHRLTHARAGAGKPAGRPSSKSIPSYKRSGKEGALEREIKNNFNFSKIINKNIVSMMSRKFSLAANQSAHRVLYVRSTL